MEEITLNDEILLVLKDSAGINWGLFVFHDPNENIKQFYTREVDQEGLDSIKIKSFDGYFKIKIGTNGQIFTYPVDDLG